MTTKRKIVTGLTLCSSLFLTATVAYSWYFSTTAQLDRYVTAFAKQGKFVGSVLVAHKGKILLSKGYGMANYEHLVPNTPQTKFHIGSITKQFTSMAIMQLVQRGKLALKDTVASILPDYPNKSITVYQLLTHTAGIPNYTSFPDFDSSKEITLSGLIALFKDKPLEFVSGSKFAYSNSGYVLLAAIIEKLSGISYEQFLQKNIWGPLGMKNTGLLHDNPPIMHRAQGYSMTNGVVCNVPCYSPSVGVGAGMLYSTVEDLYTWDRALYTEKLLPKKLLEQLWTPCLDNYCLGWFMYTVDGKRLVWHSGGWTDCDAVIARFIDDEVCIIALSNVGNLGIKNSLVHDLADIVFGKNKKTSQHHAININPDLFDAYVGKYEINPQLTLTVIRDGGHLLMQGTNQQAVEVLSESETKFFNDDIAAEILFVKDAAGKVTQLILHQSGTDYVAKKMSDVGRTVVKLDSAVYEKYVGKYTIEALKLVLTVSVSAGALLVQLTGQPAFQVFPESETKFFYKAVDAQIVFNKNAQGSVDSLTLYQGGETFMAKKQS